MGFFQDDQFLFKVESVKFPGTHTPPHRAFAAIRNSIHLPTKGSICSPITLTKLVMTFKRRRRTNTAMPGNTDIPANAAAMPIFLTGCETEMHMWKCMTESELLCVRVATLLRNKYASMLRVMS